MAKNWVLFSIVLCARAASAQEDITEDALLRRLSPEHPSLVALRAAVGEAEGAVARARALKNPDFAFGVEAPRDIATQTTVSLVWSPPLDGRRGLRIDSAEAALSAARLELAAAELQLRVGLRAAYADWSVAHTRRELLSSQLALVERIARHVRDRANSGEASGLSARRVELAVGEERAELARAESTLARARAAVCALYPQLAANTRPVLSALPATVSGIDPSARPDVQARLQDVRRFEFDAREARRYLAFPALEFGWQRLELAGSEWSGPVYGFAWSIPLFDRRQGDRLASARRLEAARAQSELAARLSSAEAEGAEAAYSVLRDAALASAASFGDADTLVESVTAAYDLGEADTTDLLETLRSVLRARLTAFDLYADAMAAHRALEVAAGRPLLPSEGVNR